MAAGNGNGRIPASIVPGMPPGSPALRGGGCEPVDPCLAAWFQEYERSLGTTDLMPHITAPIDARYFHFTTPYRGLINVPAATDADANLAGTNLAAAEGVFQAVTITVAPTATPTALNKVFTYVCPQGHIAIVKKWGFSVQAGDPAAANVKIDSAGPTAMAEAPNPLLSGASYDKMEDTLLVLPENNGLTLSVGNLDTSSPLLFTFAMVGWLIQRKWNDSRQSMLPRPGYSRRG